MVVLLHGLSILDPFRPHEILQVGKQVQKIQIGREVMHAQELEHLMHIYITCACVRVFVHVNIVCVNACIKVGVYI